MISAGAFRLTAHSGSSDRSIPTTCAFGRREQQRELDDLGKKTLKWNRFLLLCNYKDLEPDRRARLHALLQVNEPLFIIHSMKEQLRIFWDKENWNAAKTFLKTWCQDALQSGIKQLVKVAKTLAGYRTGLLNSFKHPITSAMVEGDQQQNQDIQKAGLRVPRQGVFLAQIIPPPYSEVLVNRMNLLSRLRSMGGREAVSHVSRRGTGAGQFQRSRSNETRDSIE